MSLCVHFNVPHFGWLVASHGKRTCSICCAWLLIIERVEFGPALLVRLSPNYYSMQQHAVTNYILLPGSSCRERRQLEFTQLMVFEASDGQTPPTVAALKTCDYLELENKENVCFFLRTTMTTHTHTCPYFYDKIYIYNCNYIYIIGIYIHIW